MRNTLLHQAIRTVLNSGISSAMILGTASAYAQSAPDTSQKESGSQSLETIVVTGSNIRRVDLETANPVVTIDRETIQKTGKLTLGDLMQALPAVTGGNSNPTVNNAGGGGSSSVGLRGLGAERTLVLIDGHRTVSPVNLFNGSGGVDINAIPIDMVERIEVLTSGASAVYGSDAIAGVVNVILRKEYQGAEFSADYGISDHDDGERKGFHFLFGQSSDKGSLSVGVDYNKTDQISANNRAFGKQAIDLTASPSTPPYSYLGGSSYPAYGRIQLTPAQSAVFGCGYVALSKGGNSQIVSPANYHCYVKSNDAYNYAAVNLVETPQERSSLFANGLYHLTDNVDAFLTVFHTHTSASFQLAPGLFGHSFNGNISAQSYYNPFGVDFGNTGNDFRLRLVAAGNRGADTTNTTDQLNAGLSGRFDLGKQSWTFTGGFGFGHVSLSQKYINYADTSVLDADLGPSFLDPTTGVVTCGTPAAPITTNCTPFDPFNQFSPNSIKAIQAASVPTQNTFMNLERYEHLDLTGGVFDLPAGTSQAAFGVVHRQEYTSNQIDSLQNLDQTTRTCALGSQCSAPLQGGYSVKEAYAELFVPLLKDLPFANSLNMTLGERFSKYDLFGSTSNWKAQFEYRPIEDLMIRGSVSKVFRAPTIANVYEAPISSAPTLSSDPCNYSGTGANPNASNPACKGVPANGPFINQDVLNGQQINAYASGAKFAGLALKPEFGKTFDWGFVYDPQWLTGLSMSADLWRIYLINDIVEPTSAAQNILTSCFYGITQYCPFIDRFQSGPQQGEISSILVPTINQGRFDTQGVDLAVHYKLPETEFGRFTLGMDATYSKQFKTQTAPGTAGNQVYELAGHVIPNDSAALASCPINTGVCTFPRWKALASLQWNLGSFDASWRVRYIGRVRLGNPDLSESQSSTPGLGGQFFDIGAYVYNDLRFGYNIEALNARIDAGIDNITNKQPPLMYWDTNTLNLGTDPSTYDVIGRYYSARITIKF